MVETLPQGTPAWGGTVLSSSQLYLCRNRTRCLKKSWKSQLFMQNFQVFKNLNIGQAKPIWEPPVHGQSQARFLRQVCDTARGFPGGSDGKESACNAGDLGSIHGSGRSPGEGNGNPFQYSCLGNPIDRGAWWATVHGVAKSWTRLSN